MGIIKYMGALTLTALFAIFLVTFALEFGVNNNAGVKLSDDSDYENFTTTMTSEEQDSFAASEIAFKAFQETTVQSQTDSSEGGTQFKVGIGNMVSKSRLALKIGYDKVFGTAPEYAILFTSLFGAIGVIFIFYAWKAWKGNPD